MDGRTYTVPYEEAEEESLQLNFFTSMKSKKIKKYCKIKDWRAQKTIEYRELVSVKK